MAARHGVAAGGAMEIAQLDKNSRAVLGEIDKLLKEDVENTRKTCASGQAPEWVKAKRARGGSARPFADASDMCLATLRGVAGEHRLLSYYRDLLVTAGGDPATYAAFPRSIGASLLGGAMRVPIGNGKAAIITPALAFDAGFTAGYQEGAAAKPIPVDPRQVKAIAEACLGQQKEAGTCFSIGYVYGAQGVMAQPKSSGH